MPSFCGCVPPVVVASVLILYGCGRELRRIQVIQTRDVDRDVFFRVRLRFTDEAVGGDAAVPAEAAVYVATVFFVPAELAVAGDGSKVLRLRAHAPGTAFPTTRAVALRRPLREINISFELHASANTTASIGAFRHSCLRHKSTGDGSSH